VRRAEGRPEAAREVVRVVVLRLAIVVGRLNRFLEDKGEKTEKTVDASILLYDRSFSRGVKLFSPPRPGR